MDPELRKQFYLRKHFFGIFTIIALAIMLPVTLLFTQISAPQTKQFAAVKISPSAFIEPTLVPASPTSAPAQKNYAAPSANTASTKLRLTLCLHGIGSCGDNVASQSSGNTNPIRVSRPFTAGIYNKDFLLIKDIQGLVVYSPALGKFSGEIDAGNLVSANYNIKILFPGFLPAFFPVVQTINSGEINTLPSLSLVNGDIDRNNILNLNDYTLLMKCFDKPNQTNPCSLDQQQAADLNDDSQVNGIDYNLLMRETANQKTLK